jgi:hypothetical protein
MKKRPASRDRSWMWQALLGHGRNQFRAELRPLKSSAFCGVLFRQLTAAVRIKGSRNPHHNVGPYQPATVSLLHDHVAARTAQSTAAVALVEECQRTIRIESDP